MFPAEKILRRMKELEDSPIYHTIRVIYDKEMGHYCLMNSEEYVLLYKSMVNRKDEFEEEVQNLSKYFNAKIIRE